MTSPVVFDPNGSLASLVLGHFKCSRSMQNWAWKTTGNKCNSFNSGGNLLIMLGKASCINHNFWTLLKGTPIYTIFKQSILIVTWAWVVNLTRSIQSRTERSWQNNQSWWNILLYTTTSRDSKNSSRYPGVLPELVYRKFHCTFGDTDLRCYSSIWHLLYIIKFYILILLYKAHTM